jgi:hypothetical protein
MKFACTSIIRVCSYFPSCTAHTYFINRLRVRDILNLLLDIDLSLCDTHAKYSLWHISYLSHGVICINLFYS